jgi:pimeloyl-ACP methyl ester carboxylesterase
MNFNKASPESLYSRSEGNGPPVVLLHGLGGSSEEWSQVSFALVESGFQTHRVDLPGHGSSEKPADPEDYRSERFLERIDAWYQNLQLREQAVIIAHSFGAYLAINLAAVNPGSFRCLVFVSPYFYSQQLLPLMKLTVRRPRVASRILEAAPRRAIETVMQFANIMNNGMPATAVHRTAVDLARASPKIVHTAPSIVDQRPKLQEIQIPTLLVWGERDLTLNPASFPELLDKLPNSRGLAFEQNGHAPHLASPDTFNRNLLEFLADNL